MFVRRATFLAAALVWPLSARAQGSEAPASPEALEAARRLFFEGYAAGERGQWEPAYRAFVRALALRASPAVRFNLATAARNTGRLVEALDQYRTFLRETPAGTDTERRRAAEAEVERLSARVARLRVEVAGDTVQSFALDGRAQPVALLGVEIPVDPGPHTVEVEGAAGDRQRREGALYEGEAMRVEIELTRDAVAARAAATTPRSQGFGHWVTRPGPDGRWIDWAAQAVPEAPRSVWEARPLTFAVQLGLGTATGALGVSARYFPRPWFGAEVSAGALGPFQPGFAFLMHLRFARANARQAFGIFAGPGIALASLDLTCPAQSTQCTRAETVSRTLPAISLVAGLSSEWRLGSHLAFRVTAGLREIVNPADFRALEDPRLFTGCASPGALGWGTTACNLRFGSTRPSDPFVAIDLGYTL